MISDEVPVGRLFGQLGQIEKVFLLLHLVLEVCSHVLCDLSRSTVAILRPVHVALLHRLLAPEALRAISHTLRHSRSHCGGTPLYLSRLVLHKVIILRVIFAGVMVRLAAMSLLERLLTREG